jgi:internalin A
MMKKKPKVILDLEKYLNLNIEKYTLNDAEEVIFLNLSSNQLSDISPLSSLVNLTFLNLSSNQIRDISPLSSLVNLSLLNLSSNQISDISPLSNLRNLSLLYLVNNQISDISPLSSLVNLTLLNLSSNQISDISPFLSSNSLSSLDLSSNRISNISPLSSLVNLSLLDLMNNQISDISPLSSLVCLSSLDLSSNQISDISPLVSLLEKSRLRKSIYDNKFISGTGAMNIYNNPLPQDIINAIKSLDKQALVKYIESRKRGKARIPEAKMVLLGEPRAGKTTLQKYLMGLPINENEESTPDIQISSWKPFENDSEEKNRDIKINLWDFGGQEIQYSLHKLFMTEDTLYIIVLDSTKDQSPLKYLKFLENYAPNSPFIIINNYGDAPTSNILKIDENYLRENYNGKEGMPVLKAIFNRVSILKAAKLDPSFRKIMDEVEETIKNELLNLKNLNKEFPKEYQLVKSAIEQEYSKPDKHYITMSYYRELCKSLKITDDEELRKAILGYLNEIGVLRYFKDSPVTDKHILNPKWLIDGAYSLIIDEETANNFGVLTKNQARNILKRSKKGFKFEEEESEFIFKTMKFYGLLHSDENEQKVYIPLRFKSLQPTTLLDFYENGKHFAFEFKSDIPEEIISNLIVKHFEEIRQKYYWSKGAVFESNKVRILVKVEDRNIHFYVQGQFHQNYFEILRRTLRKSLERLPGLGYEEIGEFELNNKKIRVVYDYLVDVLVDGEDYFKDPATKTKVYRNEIIEILGGYFSKQEISQITNNFYYGNVYQNDNRFQQITIIQELNSLVQLAQNIEDKKALEEIKSEIQLLNQTNEVEEKESLGKKLLGKIKQLSTDSLDDVVKEKLKELFPKIVEKGIDWVEKVDFDGIMQIFGGIL